MKAKVWIARDKDGSLWLYSKEPERNDSIFWNDDEYLEIDKNSHSEITWENSPQQIEI